MCVYFLKMSGRGLSRIDAVVRSGVGSRTWEGTGWVLGPLSHPQPFIASPLLSSPRPEIVEVGDCTQHRGRGEH